MTFENGFDQIPPDIEEKGAMFDGGNMAQINHEPIEGLQSPLLPFGEVNGLPQITATTSTLLEMTMQNDELFSSPHRKGMKLSRECTVHDHINPSGTTMQ